jgi:hypothetical protein
MKKKVKTVYKSIRKVWLINPKSRIKDDRREEHIDICDDCGCLDDHLCQICKGR